MKKRCKISYVLKGFWYWLKTKNFKKELIDKTSSKNNSKSIFHLLMPFLLMAILVVFCLGVYAPLIQSIEPPAWEKLLFIYIPLGLLGCWVIRKLGGTVSRIVFYLKYFCELGQKLEAGDLP